VRHLRRDVDLAQEALAAEAGRVLAPQDLEGDESVVLEVAGQA
jgi:hypothetical protein